MARDPDLMDNTLFVLLSDHGVDLGEHGFTGKVSSELYPELVDAPFLIRHPEGRGAGQESDYFASTHNVSPTILGTVGYDRHILTRDERYAPIPSNDGTEPKLFDLQNDPSYENDIAKDNPDVVSRMFEEYVVADAGGSPPRH